MRVCGPLLGLELRHYQGMFHRMHVCTVHLCLSPTPCRG